MVSICRLTRSILHPITFPPLLKFSFFSQKIIGEYKTNFDSEEIALISLLVHGIERVLS